MIAIDVSGVTVLPEPLSQRTELRPTTKNQTPKIVEFSRISLVININISGEKSEYALLWFCISFPMQSSSQGFFQIHRQPL